MPSALDPTSGSFYHTSEARRSAQNAGRIVCLTIDYPPMRGGVARYLSELKKASDGRMEVWVPREHPHAEERERQKDKGGEDCERVKFWWGGWPKWWPLVQRCLEIGVMARKSARIKDNSLCATILVSHVFPVGTAAWIASFFGGPEYCVLFHGTDLARVRSLWKHWLLKRVTARARGLFTNSQATAKALQRLVPVAKPTVVTPGVKEFEGPDRRQARSELGIEESAFVILSVSRLVERKGIDILIEAVAKIEVRSTRNEARHDALRTPSSGLQLVVVGNGPYSGQLHELAELMKVNVRWVENASDDDVKKWYAAADVFCLPAREQANDVEGFGIVFLEAAAAGLPVIAGKSWGTSEAVLDGVTGLLVDSTADDIAGAINKLMGDEDLRKRLGSIGRERVVRDFCWSDRWAMIWSEIGGRVAESTFYIPNSTKMSDIAVVIPCHNNAAELVQTLEALAEQTLKPREVMVVDNLSDDKPENVVNRFLSRLPIRCVRHEKERGAPVARNYGYALTQAPYVLFLDADTVLVPEALQKMRNALAENPSATFAYSNFYWGRILFRGKPWDAMALAKMNFIHTSALVKRDALERIKNDDGKGPFDPSLKKFQDWDLWLTLSENGCSGVWINEVLFSVTQQKNGMSNWLPAFIHKMPWPILGWAPREVRRYREAEKIIRKKHGIRDGVICDQIRHP